MAGFLSQPYSMSLYLHRQGQVSMGAKRRGGYSSHRRQPPVNELRVKVCVGGKGVIGKKYRLCATCLLLFLSCSHHSSHSDGSNDLLSDT